VFTARAVLWDNQFPMGAKLLMLVLLAQLSIASLHALQENMKSSDQGWTTTQLRSEITAQVRRARSNRVSAAEQIGANYAAAGPSKSFVAAALNLFRSTDPIARAAVFSSLNTPNDNVRGVLPFLPVAAGDPQPYNRRAVLLVLMTLDPFGSTTLSTLIDRAYLDADADTRGFAQKNLNEMLGRMKDHPIAIHSLKNSQERVLFLRNTTNDEADRQSLEALSASFERLINDLQPRSTLPSPLSIPQTLFGTIRSNKWLKSLVAIVALLIVVHVTYLVLWLWAPVTLYKYANAPYPWFLVPYLLAPTAYRYSRHLSKAVLEGFRDEDGIEVERFGAAQKALRGAPGEKRQDALKRVAAVLLASPDNKAHQFLNFLQNLAPHEARALRAIGQVPSDFEIIWAREQMTSILQVPEGTVSKPGLRLEHSIRQATTISGDFYNIIPRGDGSLGVYMVDVNGHGLAAALHAVQTHLLLKTAEPHWGVGRPKQQLDMADDLIRKVGGGSAVCMSFLEISLSEKKVRYASAGIQPALLFSSGQSQPVQLQAAGHPVGKGYKFCGVQPAEAEHSITEGDILILYSDGVIEARSADGKLFGTDGIEAAVRTAPSRDARSIRDSIMDGCARFSSTAQPRDDQSLVVIQIATSRTKEHAIQETSLHVARNDSHGIEATLRKTDDVPSAVLKFLRDDVVPFAVKHIEDRGIVQGMNDSLLEALTNSLRHGTQKGEFLEIKVSAVSKGTIEVKLVQQNEWKTWDEMLGRHRLNEIAARKSAFRQGDLDKPDVSYLGTQLIVANSLYTECSQDGREQRFGFGTSPEPDEPKID
jgi:hypothetical protein